MFRHDIFDGIFRMTGLLKRNTGVSTCFIEQYYWSSRMLIRIFGNIINILINYDPNIILAVVFSHLLPCINLLRHKVEPKYYKALQSTKTQKKISLNQINQTVIIFHLISFFSSFTADNNLFFYLMMNRMTFKNYQSMNCVHKTKDGSQIWLGDYYAASNIQLLKQKNITSVLTSGAMLNINYPKQHNINHKIINAFDIPSYKMTPHFDQAFHFINDALKRGHILVHCAAGISRSTTFVMVYMLRGQGMTFANALPYIRAKRSIVNPNYGFQNQLKKFQMNLKKGKKEDKNYQQYSNVQEKKAVLDFLNQQKQRPMKSQLKFNSTYGGNNTALKRQELNKQILKNNNGVIRGQSVNYSKKLANSYMIDNKKGINNYMKEFDYFKTQAPKIVTIKR